MEAAAAKSERRVRRGARREICTCMVVVSDVFLFRRPAGRGLPAKALR